MSRTAVLLYGLVCFFATGVSFWALSDAQGFAAALCVAASYCFIAGALLFTLWGLYGDFDDAEIEAGIVIKHGHEPGYRLPMECIRAPYVSRLSMRDSWLPATDVPERWSLTIMDEEGRTAVLYFDFNILRDYPVSSYYPGPNPDA